VQHKIRAIPDLATLHAVPNSVGASKGTQAKRKAEGVVPGMPDIHWPVARGVYIGLWIEFKIPGKTPTSRQREMHTLLVQQGHAVVTCTDAQAAFDATMQYHALPPG
jgi:hypothetical protein